MLGSFNARMKLKSIMFAVIAITNLGLIIISEVIVDYATVEEKRKFHTII